MSVSDELLCSFELLKPLDSSALKNHIKKGRNKRNNVLNSPVSSHTSLPWTVNPFLTTANCIYDINTNSLPSSLLWFLPKVIESESRYPTYYLHPLEVYS